MSRALRLGLLLAGGLLGGQAAAQNLFCCTLNGVKNCGDSLPQQCIGQAYVVRAPSGKIIKQVEAPLTEAQYQAKLAAEEKRKKDLEVSKEQERKDKALLATYGSEADIDRQRAIIEKEYVEAIAKSEKRIAEVEKKKAGEIGDPEMYKRHGMPDDLRRKVVEYDFEIKTHKELIASKQKDLDGARSKFETDKKRYQEIMRQRKPGALPGAASTGSRP